LYNTIETNKKMKNLGFLINQKLKNPSSTLPKLEENYHGINFLNKSKILDSPKNLPSINSLEPLNINNISPEKITQNESTTKPQSQIAKIKNLNHKIDRLINERNIKIFKIANSHIPYQISHFRKDIKLGKI